MNNKNKLRNIILLFLFFIIPINVFAYSKYIIPGGETVGIEVNSDGVLIVGFYKVGNSFIAKNSGFEVGDRIIKLNNKKISNISDMVDYINNNDNNTIEFTILRENKEKNIKLKLEEEQGILKTGIYVKDVITGLGTLTYIDPDSRIFGALGHEIDEKTTTQKFDISGGIIFGASVYSIEKSMDGRAGEKNAKYDKTKVYGNIVENEISGIFGKYTDEINSKEKLEVCEPKNIKLGDAIIKTVVSDNTVKDYKINIIKLDNNSDTKNILFEIVDDNLIKETGGIVQGMSGSPIIQDNKIIGAVTHVIVNDTTKGYGIYITTMLKEGEN